MKIDSWRKKIDEIETQLIELLNQRANFALKIGELKREQNLPILDAGREQEILDRVANRNPGPLPAESIQRIFKTIIQETRSAEDVQTQKEG